jgi:diguanylate cyclase (GGDEF)-like protein
VSSILDHAKDPAKLNDQADQALYISKETGRNRVINWTPDSNTQPLAIPEIIEPDSDKKARIPLADHAKHAQEINQLQAQIKQLENTASIVSDQLQLPKQTLFYDRIKQALEKATRQKRLTAMLILEFDLISQANNSFGMDIAEKMLTSLTERLVSIFRKTDSITLFNYDSDDLMISRFEADEFGVLLNDLEDRQVVTWAVKRIFESMSLPISYNDKHINVTCKIGISIFPEDARSADELFSHANTAKTFALKENEVNNFQFYDPEMQKISLKQLGLEAEIVRAIKNEEWILYYQPKINISTNRIVGVEALIRWNHPERGILSPFEFIDFAEDRGLIVEIGDWVIRTACKQAKIWADQGFDLKVAINISAVQLRMEKLSSQILDIIKETQIHGD